MYDEASLARYRYAPFNSLASPSRLHNVSSNDTEIYQSDTHPITVLPFHCAFMSSGAKCVISVLM